MLGSAGAPNISNSAMMHNAMTNVLSNLDQPRIITQNTSGNVLAKIKNLADK